MRHLLLGALCLATTLWPILGAWAQAPPADRLASSSTTQGAPETRTSLSVAERAYVASRLYAGLDAYFAHWDGVPDLNVDDAYRRYLAAALATPDRRGFVLESQAFLAQFGNGHTILLDRVLLEAPDGQRLGFALRKIEDQWVVTRSERSDLRPGDVVTALDGTPFEEVYSDRRRYLSASKDVWREHLLFADIPGFFSGGLYFPVSFTLTLADGAQVHVDRQALPARPPAPTTTGRWLREESVAYIRVPSFADPQFETDAVALVEQFRAAETLVVDVRGNGGGSTPTRLHEALMERPYRWWAGSTPMAPGLHRSWGEGGNGWYGDFPRAQLAWPARVHPPTGHAFTGDVILLIDSGCHSACEDFVMPFQDNGRGLLIGEATAGSTGQPHMVDLGNGMMALIGAKRERFPSGAVFEGVGIAPDVEVPLRVDDVRAGRDAALAQALAHSGGGPGTGASDRGEAPPAVESN